MKMASGAIPHPGRVPEQELLTPEMEFRMAAEHGGVFAIMMIPPWVYALGAIYGRKGSSGLVTEGPHRTSARPDLNLGHADLSGLSRPHPNSD